MMFFYSLIVSAALLLLAVGYRFSGLGRSRDFAASRVALVCSLLFALAVGLVPFILPVPAAPPVAVADIEIGRIVVEPVAAESKGRHIDLWALAGTVYAVGAALFLLRLVVNLVRVAVIIAGSRPVGNNVRVYRRLHSVPFTWGRWILMSESDRQTDGAMLEAHERAHMHGAHWADILLANLVQCLTWYAPGAWLIKHDLAAVHEYEADAAVLGSGADAERYQMLLIQKAAGRRFANSLTANISHSSLKKRIAMMQENRRASKPRMRVLALVPAALVAVAVAVNPAVASEASALKPKAAPVVAPLAVASNAGATDNTVVAKKRVTEIYIEGIGTLSGPNVGKELLMVDGTERPFSELQSIVGGDDSYSVNVLKPAEAVAKYGKKARYGAIELTKGEKKAPEPEKIFTAAEEVPKFPGGDGELFKWLARNIRYPEAAQKSNVQGRVVVRFVVNEDGSVSDAKVVRSVSPELDTEALRVVGGLPEFKPGTVGGKPVACWYTLPIMFKLQDEKPDAGSEPKPELKDIPAGTEVQGPAFPGGEGELYKWLSRNIRYPEAAQRDKVQGRVIVQFLVQADGSVSDPKVVRGVNEDLDAEALRVVGELPKFTPGTMNGKPVGSWYTLPIMFKFIDETTPAVILEDLSPNS